MGVRGKTPDVAFVAAQSRLPAGLAANAQELARAFKMADHPKLRLILDYPNLARQNKLLAEHLQKINRLEAHKTTLINWAAGLLLNLIVLLIGLVLVLRWRGLI